MEAKLWQNTLLESSYTRLLFYTYTRTCTMLLIDMLNSALPILPLQCTADASLSCSLCALQFPIFPPLTADLPPCSAFHKTSLYLTLAALAARLLPCSAFLIKAELCFLFLLYSAVIVPAHNIAPVCFKILSLYYTLGSVLASQVHF